MTKEERLHSRKPEEPLEMVDKDRKTESTSKYPKLTIYFKPAAKSKLDALGALTGLPAWRIIDLAFERYLASIPEEDRTVIDVITKRKQEKELEAGSPLRRAAVATV
jgi:hypothetical protein